MISVAEKIGGRLEAFPTNILSSFPLSFIYLFIFYFLVTLWGM